MVCFAGFKSIVHIATFYTADLTETAGVTCSLYLQISNIGVARRRIIQLAPVGEIGSCVKWSLSES